MKSSLDSCSPAAALAEIEKLIQTKTNIVSVLQGIQLPRFERTAGSTKRVLGCGAPAQWLTVSKIMERKQPA